MRKVLLAAMTLASAAAAMPAAAQWAPAPPPYGYGYGYGRPDYGYRGQLDSLARDIDAGWRRGVLTGGEARGLRRELDYLYQLDRRASYDGYRGYERDDLQRRIGRLAERVRYEARDGDYRRDGWRGDGYYRDWRR